jgi:exoribonuclease R
MDHYSDHTNAGDIKLFDAKFKNNRALPGDIVYVKDNVVTGIYQRCTDLIVGVLILSATKIIKTNKRGVIVYEFVPLDLSYPRFHVAYKNKKKSKIDCFATIKFHEWKNTKHPTGVIEGKGILGSVNIYEHEVEALVHKYHLQEYLKTKRSITPIETKRTRVSFEDKIVFTIDPADCNDIDDALHIEKTESGYELGVHIADVSSKLSIEPTVFTTLYLNKNYNMIPSEYSEKQCSLWSKTTKNTLSVVINLDEDGTISSYEFVPGKINSVIKASYDDVYTHPIIQPSLKLLEKLFDVTDSHKIVEKAMVLANTLAGDHIVKNNKVHILRVHKKSTISEVPTALPDKLHDHLTFKQMNTATYEVNPEIRDHSGLDVKCYTHFTSPIRRYADYMVHQMIYGEYNKSLKETIDIVDKINRDVRLSKKLYRDFQLLNLYYDLGSDIVETKGYIIKYNIINNKVTVWLPDYELECKYHLFSQKLHDLMEVKYEDNVIVVSNLETEEIKRYELFKELNISLSKNISTYSISNRVVIRIH